MEDQKEYLFDTEIQGISMIPAGKPFKASAREFAAALIMYLAAYLYVDRFLFTVNTWSDPWILVFAVLFVLMTEIVCREIPRRKESFLWLGCLTVVAVSAGFRCVSASGKFGMGFLNHSVWDYDQLILFLHIFGVWYVLSRSGRLLEGESGHLLPVDAASGFVLFPFGNFFLRVRVLFSQIRNALQGRQNKDKKKLLWTAAAAVIAVILLINAIRLMAEADSGYDRLIGNLKISLRLDFGEDFGEFFAKFLFSLPVAAYLYGLIAGSARTEEPVIEGRRVRILRLLEKLRAVSAKLWLAVIAVFTVFYFIFFFLQGEYLFGAFAGRLPDGFIVSEYARQGFFELCRIIALNFSLLWLVTRVCDTSTDDHRALRMSCIVFLGESMLFCVIAFSKLLLYINCFGFTPLRLQSSWLVCVLFAGCVLWTVELLTRKKVFRKWMIFGAVSLSLLAVV